MVWLKVFERRFWKVPESEAKHVELEVFKRRDVQDADIDEITKRRTVMVQGTRSLALSHGGDG